MSLFNLFVLYGVVMGQGNGQRVPDAVNNVTNTSSVNQGTSNTKPTWEINLVNHPDISNEFGTLSLIGNTDAMRQFFATRQVRVKPGCTDDTRLVSSFLNVFPDMGARAIKITLECTCCPLKCTLTISVSF
jgi:hypothetical protein